MSTPRSQLHDGRFGRQQIDGAVERQVQHIVRRAILKAFDFDNCLRSRLRDQAIAPALPRKQIEDGILGRLGRVFLTQPEHIHEQASIRIGSAPAGQLFGNRIHEDDFAAGIGSDEAFSDTPQHGRKPGFAAT